MASQSVKGRRRRDIVQIAFRRGTRPQVQAAQFVRYRRVFFFLFLCRRQFRRAAVVLAVGRQSTAVRHVRRQLATRGQHKPNVRWRWLQWTRQVLRVILYADKVWVICTHSRNGSNLFIYYDIVHSDTHTHTHTHTHPFNGPLSGTTRVSRYQKGKNQSAFY